jgi:N-acetylneuraminate synthase
MIERYKLVTGLSDHTVENTTAIASVSLGASIIEKHFTLDRNRGGPDDGFSLEPDELFELCRATRIAWTALGKIDYSRKPSEEGTIKFRRSLYYTKSLEAGAILTLNDLRSVRPGYGLPPKNLYSLVGKQLAKDVRVNSPVKEDDFIVV